MTATNGKKPAEGVKLPPEVVARPQEDERTFAQGDRKAILAEILPIDTTADPAAVASDVKQYHQESQRSAARSVVYRWHLGVALLAMWARLAPEGVWEKWCKSVGLSSQEVSRCMRLARAFRQVRDVVDLTWGEAVKTADEEIEQQRLAEGRRTRKKKASGGTGKDEGYEAKGEKKKEEEGKDGKAKGEKDGEENEYPTTDIPEILPFPASVPKRAPKNPRAKAEENYKMSYLPGQLVEIAGRDLQEAVRRLAGRPVSREESVNIRANLEAVQRRPTTWRNWPGKPRLPVPRRRLSDNGGPL